MSDLNQLINQARDEFLNCSKLADLDHIKAKFLGKTGPITEAMKSLSRLPVEERPQKGAEINQIKNQIEDLLNARKKEIADHELNQKLENEKIDVTLPSRPQDKGSLHPVMKTIEDISQIFHSIGFDVTDGPEIEDDFHNFEALNIPESHPARAMHDTFYFDEHTVLRTHTSPVQIRVMKDKQPPLRVIAPGRVYRCDSDLTHTPMFHQVEGLLVDEDVSFAQLKGILDEFLRNFFEKELA